jgi:hypothetical protein
LASKKGMDGRDKPGHDAECVARARNTCPGRSAPRSGVLLTRDRNGMPPS